MASALSYRVYKNALILSSLLASAAQGQQVGTYTSETHPSMTWETCTSSGSCTTVDGSVTIDANWRWVHQVGSSTNCYTGNTWDTSICDTDETCATKCAVEGASYESTYGITTSGSEIRLNFVTQNSGNTNVGSRLYMMQDEDNYEIFKLLNQEFTFDVDVSNLPCGLNGALYFVVMDQDGGKSKYANNAAGAKYGVGYCDAQCPRDLKFIQGQANVEGWVASSNNANTGLGNHGSCCAELDIWESNSISQALTPHSCETVTSTLCEGDACGGTYSADRYAGICDPDGCDFNPYRMGNTTFYGPGMTIDTTKSFTVVTQFITDDGTDTGTLSEIRRFYVQDGVTYAQPNSDVSGVSGNAINTEYCTAENTAFGGSGAFAEHGGLESVSEALSTGMVLVLSLWDDYYSDMLWLDSDYPTDKSTTTPGVARGSCSTGSGVPATIESASPSSYVKYSNIKVGPIGSTFSGGSSSSGSSSGSSSTTKSTSTTTSSKTSSTTKATTTTTKTITTTTTTTVKAATTKATTSTTKSTTATTTTTTAKAATTKATTTEATASTTTSASTSTGTGTSTEVAQHYYQCGGIGWTGPTTCASGYTCTAQNPYYYQCV